MRSGGPRPAMPPMSLALCPCPCPGPGPEGEPLAKQPHQQPAPLSLAIRAALHHSRPQPDLRCTLDPLALCYLPRRQRDTNAKRVDPRCSLVPGLKMSNQHELEHPTVPIRRRVYSLKPPLHRHTHTQASSSAYSISLTRNTPTARYYAQGPCNHAPRWLGCKLGNAIVRGNRIACACACNRECRIVSACACACICNRE